jgi:hypothetical protein
MVNGQEFGLECQCCLVQVAAPQLYRNIKGGSPHDGKKKEGNFRIFIVPGKTRRETPCRSTGESHTEVG